MRDVTVKRVNQTLKRARDKVNGSESSLLTQKIKSLLALRRKFKKIRNDYLTTKLERKRFEKETMDYIYVLITKVEAEVLRSGNKICLSHKIPLGIDNIISFIKETIDKIEQIKIAEINKYVERLKILCSDLSLKGKENKKRLSKIEKELSTVRNEIEKEIAATEQVLEPEKYVIVNVRDRFEQL